MKNLISREIRLKRRPEGLPVDSDFELARVPMPEIRDGELLVRNIYMSVDPYMRGRMMDRKSYVPPFQLNQPLDGGAVGQVVDSKSHGFKIGDYVLNFQGWREYVVSDGTGLTLVDPGMAPVTAYLGVLGMTGLTAYVGLLEIGKAKAGDTVFVSAASGAVGSQVCQIAKLKGCRVIGSVGSDEKVAWLLEKAGVDGAFNYKQSGNLTHTVQTLCPGGIDVYYENVGGEHLEAALESMNPYGRVVMCGMISQYNAVKPPAGPANLAYVVGKSLTLQGFIVSDYLDRMPQFFTDMGKWIAEDRITWKETIVEGIENAPAAFCGLFKGENFGKMIVKVGPDPAV